MSEHGESALNRRHCEDVQSVLFDYMARELGPARSELVREHLRRCEACQAEAARIQETLDLLHEASPNEVPARLSEEHLRLLRRAVLHPLLDWIYRHHVLSSILCALVLLAAMLLGFTRWMGWRPEPVMPGLEVQIAPAPDSVTNQP